MKKFLIILCVVALVPPNAARADYADDVAKWRRAEEADLTKEDGWLALAGLFWLKEGVNTVGAGTQFDVRLTDNFKQGRFGAIDFHNGKATLRVAEGVAAQAGGKPISTITLVSDEAKNPTEIQTGSELFYLIRREDRFGIRLKDRQSKARLTFKGQRWFPIDESYKVRARLDAFPQPQEIRVPNVLGGSFKMKSPGILKFSVQGKACSLQPVIEDDGSLFLIFRDASNLDDTDETGRFLHADKAVNGETVLDFNKAENPPCAFTPYATCPLAPPGNDLKIAIKAGEKRYVP